MGHDQLLMVLFAGLGLVLLIMAVDEYFKGDKK